MNQYTLGTLVFGGTGTFTLNGVTDRRVNPGIKEHITAAAGQPGPSHVTIMNQEPSYSATVTDVAKCLTNLGILPVEVNSGGSGLTSATAYFTRVQDLGVRGGNSTAAKIASTRGLIVPRTLTCRQNSVATLSLDFWPTSADGTTNPIAITTGLTLPETPAITEIYTLGPVDVNGTTVPNVVGWSLDFGLDCRVKYEAGYAYPTFVAAWTQEPSLRIQTEDGISLSTYGVSGTAQGATASHLYLAKTTLAGLRVADATTEHVKITVNASQGLVYVGDIGGSNNGETTSEAIFRPIVGSSAILTVSGASAITRV